MWRTSAAVQPDSSDFSWKIPFQRCIDKKLWQKFDLRSVLKGDRSQKCPCYNCDKLYIFEHSNVFADIWRTSAAVQPDSLDFSKKIPFQRCIDKKLWQKFDLRSVLKGDRSQKCPCYNCDKLYIFEHRGQCVSWSSNLLIIISDSLYAR